MNCHGDNKGKQSNHNHSPLKHMLHMVICCGLPIVLVGLLPIITRFNAGAGSFISKITPFLCPLMMLLMLPMMFGGNKNANCCDNKNSNSDDSKLLEANKLVE